LLNKFSFALTWHEENSALPLHFQPIYINNQAFRGFQVLILGLASFCFVSSKMTVKNDEKDMSNLSSLVFIKNHYQGLNNHFQKGKEKTEKKEKRKP